MSMKRHEAEGKRQKEKSHSNKLPPSASRLVPSSLLPPQQAAALLGVATDSLTRWEKEGFLHPKRTLGRHRRFRRVEVVKLLGALEDAR